MPCKRRKQRGMQNGGNKGEVDSLGRKYRRCAQWRNNLLSKNGGNLVFKLNLDHRVQQKSKKQLNKPL